MQTGEFPADFRKQDYFFWSKLKGRNKCNCTVKTNLYILRQIERTTG